MADEKKTLKSAQDSLSLIQGYPNVTTRQGGEIEKAFKERKLPLETIQKTIEAIQKDAKLYDSNIDDAEKDLKELQKFKSPEATALAKKLETAIKASTKAVKELNGSLDIADKLWTKAWDADKELGQSLKRMLDAAEDSMRNLKSKIISVPGQIELLQDNVAKKLPPQTLKNSLPIVTSDVKELGAQITTAQSVRDSLIDAIKREPTVYMPAVKKAIEDAESAKKELDSLIAKSRSLIASAVTDIKTVQQALAQMAA